MNKDSPHVPDAERRGTAVIVGASLAGLMTGLTLSRAGIDVTMLERSGPAPRTGGALGVNEGLLDRITGQDRSKSRPRRPSLPSGVQTWTTVHAGLRAAVDADPHIELRHHSPVQSVGQDAESAWATTVDQLTVRGDIVIGADGHRSIVRASVAPESPNATFANYVIWLGVADEEAISSAHRWPHDVAFLSDGNGYLLGYPLPGHDGSVATGSRQLGWAWYDASRNGLLREKGAVVGDVVRHSLASSDLPEATYRELADEASDRWPSPWRDAILDGIGRRAVTGTPVAEYVPDRLVNGRLALVGNAAHVPTPMTGTGFDASLHDAEAIAESIGGGGGHGSVAQALREYEKTRLRSARSLVQSGQQFSRSFAGTAARIA